jgi:RNA polymerase sigma-70 factor (ECF subfamily)
MIEKQCFEKTDAELVELSLQHSDNFLCLLKRYEKKLLYYIIRLSGFREEDAEDILQEVFVKTYYNLRDFDNRLKFSSWIYRIAHNETISALRKKKVRPADLLDDASWLKIATQLDLQETVDNNLLNERIKKVIEHLDEKYRDVLVLRFLEEKEYAEISDILKKPVNTVSTLINRARKIFIKEFNKYGRK